MTPEIGPPDRPIAAAGIERISHRREALRHVPRIA